MSKRSKVIPVPAIRPKGIPRDKPISREILEGRRQAVMRPCHCLLCGKWFMHHQNSCLCPECQRFLDLSCKAAQEYGIPNGNLPPGMTRVTKTVKPATGKGVRPAIAGNEGTA